MLTTKNFSDIVTFSRASSGWSFGSGGVLVQTPPGAPRLDFDPITLAAQGLLSEGPSANICKYGTKLSSWAMTAGVTVDEDVALAPNGSLEADRVTYDGSNTATYRIVGNSGVVSTSGIPYTASIWLRADTPTAIRIYGNGSGAAGSYVTCNVTSQWQRFWTSGVGNGTSSLQVILYSATNNEPFSVYAWCGQIEQGAFPSSSIPTSGDAQVARAADIASITDLSKIAFNPSEGAIFVDFMVPRLAAGAGADPGQGVVGLVGSYPNFLFGVGVGSTGRINLYRTINGVTLGGLGTSNSLTVGSVARLGIAWSAAKGDAMCLNGGPVVTGTGTNLAGMTELRIGRFAGNPSYLNGCVRAVSVVPVRPDDAAFQARTAL